MKFINFAKSLQELEETNSRLAMTGQLAKLFKQFNHEEIPPAVYMMQGKLVPAYESLEFNLSVKMVLRALARLNSAESSSGEMGLFGNDAGVTNLRPVQDLYKKLGDLGLVAEQISDNQSSNSKSKDLLEVFNSLREIAKDAGIGSQERKITELVKLLKQLQPISNKYVVRIIIGKLRLGFSTMTILDALSWSTSSDKSWSKQLEEAYNRRADVGLLAQEYLANKKLDLSKIKAQVGVPVVSALCQRLNSEDEIIEKMHIVIVEPKYDGMRVQVHINKKAKVIKAFTRNLEEVSSMFPELIKIAEKLDCKSCILDTEAVGIDKKTGKIVTFQETIQRKRKHSVAQKAVELPIKFFVFDILELDGSSLIDEKLQERKELLKKLFKDNEYINKTPFIVTSDASILRKFHEAQLAKGLEGAVIKQVHSQYSGGRKGWHWVKIKEMQGRNGKLSDTLDLIIMGYYFGRGKRADFGIGAFLVGVLQKKSSEIKTIAKIGTGLSDDTLKQMKKSLEQIKTNIKPKNYQVHKNLIPDVWVEPKLVVEIAADEITKSPVHSAGVALRFPRLIRIRDDKSWQDATTLKELDGIQVSK